MLSACTVGIDRLAPDILLPSGRVKLVVGVDKMYAKADVVAEIKVEEVPQVWTLGNPLIVFLPEVGNIEA